MAYTVDQLKTFFTNANAGTAPTAAQTLTLQALANQNAAGTLTNDQALSSTVDLASDTTTAVSVGTYQFFLGFAPSEAGLTSLNSAYVSGGSQAGLNGENRFIAQAVSLALQNTTAKASFNTSYGSLSVADATKAAYNIIIGNAAAAAAGINVDNAVAYLTSATSIAYYTAFVKANVPGLTTAADIDLAVKAAIVGEILYAATTYNNGAGLGSYATASTALIKDLADDGHLVANNTAGVDLFGSYGSGGVGSTFVLTTGVDTFPGTGGNDTFIADNTVSAVGSVADSITGGAGVDTLKVYGNFDSVPQMTGVENVIADTIANGKTINTSTATGVTSVTLVRAVDGATVTVADGTAVTIESNQTKATTLTVNYGATDTAANLTLKGVDLTGGTLVQTGASATTLNLTVASSSTIGTLNGSADLATVVATGAGNLTITNALETSVSKFDASGMSGKLTVKTQTAATPDATSGGVDVFDITVLGGSGNDSIDVSANGATDEVKVDAGAGDDVVTIGGVAYSASTSTNAGDSIVGGAGTDVLAVAGNLAASDLSKAISGFEVLRFTATAAGTDMSVNKLGITSIESKGDGVDVTLTGLAANTTFTIDGDGSDLAATIGTDTTADVLNVVLTGTTTTTGTVLTATNYETVNVTSSTDSDSNVNRFASITASSAKTLNISGATALTITTAALAAGATVDAHTATGAVTSTFTTSVKSYLGSAGKDTLTVATGDLKQGNTFAGNAGADVINATATASQDLGIVGLTGFETLNLTLSGSNVADLRNVTDLATISVVAAAGTNDLTLNRLSADTTLSFTNSIDQVVTTLQTGTSQKVAFTAAATVASLTLDSGTTTLTVNSDDGDSTADEANGAFTALSGTSLASIIVTGNDRLNLGTLASTVTSVDASASKGGLTVTASGTATTIVGSQAADTITGGAGADVITGGKGADVLNGGGGSDTYVFAAKGADNGDDTVTLVAGSGGDVLKFSAFLSGGTIDQNGATGTGIAAYTTGAVNDVNITNKVVLYGDTAATTTTIAAAIQGAGDAFSLDSGGKAIIIAGDTAGAPTVAASIFYVDDSLDGVLGTVSATDVVLVGHTSANFDLDTLITSNISLA